MYLRMQGFQPILIYLKLRLAKLQKLIISLIDQLALIQFIQPKTEELTITSTETIINFETEIHND